MTASTIGSRWPHPLMRSTLHVFIVCLLMFSPWIAVRVAAQSKPITTVARRRGVRSTVQSGTSVWGWGQNNIGQLGVNGGGPTPTQIAGLSNIVSIAAGDDASLALLSDGSVYAWGNNAYGELGHAPGTLGDVKYATADYYNPAPTRVAGLSGVVSVAIGAESAFALTGDGLVWAWGDNTYGQLGQEPQAPYYRSTPAVVPGLTGVTAVSAGAFHVASIDSSGMVWTWGSNWFGQIGVNSPTGSGSAIPQPQGTLFDYPNTTVRIDAGTFDTMALQSNGTVWMWGNNEADQLGWAPEEEDPNSNPTQVTNIGSISNVAVGYDHAFALGADGTVSAWGLNYAGELGHLPGSLSDHQNVVVGEYSNPSPTVISGLPPVFAISGSGNAYGLALTSGGTAYSWGLNLYGELGSATNMGTSAPNPTPTAIQGLPSVLSIASGATFALALATAGPVGPRTVTGKATLVGSVSPVQILTLTFQSNSGGLPFTRNIALAPDGTFVVTGVPKDSYTVKVKGGKWLQANVAADTTSGNVAGANVTLVPGDLNGDNVIDIEDFSLFAQAFGSADGDPSWNPSADLNSDGTVDISDFALLAQYFGQAGDL